MGLSRSWIFAVAIALNLLASASLPVLALYIGAAARFPKPVSLLAALALCFCPEALRAVGLVWDEALLTTLTALLLLYLIGQLTSDAATSPASPDPVQANPALAEPAPTITATLGFFNGLLALLNPALCIALPCAWLAALQARGVAMKKLPAHAFLLLATTFLGSSPWRIRNWFLLDPPAHVFIRDNFWLEVWSSLHPVAQIKYADGTTHSLPVHPWQGSESLTRTDTVPPTPLSEQQYFAWCKERVLAVFRDNPRLLLQHIATQFNAYWLGIAEAQRWSRNPILFFLAQGLPAIAGILGFYASRKRIPPDILALLCTLLIIAPLPYYLAGGRSPLPPPHRPAPLLWAQLGSSSSSRSVSTKNSHSPSNHDVSAHL